MELIDNMGMGDFLYMGQNQTVRGEPAITVLLWLFQYRRFETSGGRFVLHFQSHNGFIEYVSPASSSNASISFSTLFLNQNTLLLPVLYHSVGDESPFPFPNMQRLYLFLF